MAVTDDVARLTREIWRLNMALGWQSRMGFDAGTAGRLAKASGATEAQVQAWMSGHAEPTVSQALAVLDALPLPATRAAALNGAGK